MRIILWLAAGAAAMAIGSAAEARRGGPGPGQGTSPPGVWFKNDGNHGGKRVYGRFRPRAIEGDRPQGRNHGRYGRSRWGGFNPYGGGGIPGPVRAVDPYGNGFFSGGGGQIRLRGGRPYYDYDRAYPYEWASALRERPELDEVPRSAEAPSRCTMESGVRVCRGW